MAPRWWTRSVTVQSGQEGTGVSGEAWVTASRKGGPSARSPATQKSFDPCNLLVITPSRRGRAALGLPPCVQPRVKGVSDVSAELPTAAQPTVPDSLSAYTSLGLGGRAQQVLIATNADELAQSPANSFILAGGSNVVVGDGGYP